jgi:FK506-binding nuclear protein
MKQSSSKRRSEEKTKEDSASNKRRKLEEVPILDQPVKSKKELRIERKALLKAKAEKDDVSLEKEAKGVPGKEVTKQNRRDEKRQERRAKKEEKERALEARFQLQDQVKRKREAEKQESGKSQEKTNKNDSNGPKKNNSQSKKSENKNHNEPDDYAVYKSIFKKQKDPATGATTCRLGVQYIDVKVGTGPTVQPKSLVNVKYQLRGGSPNGMLIDSSKKFSFRLGKGEVIQGWEIGLEGMRQGGVRHLIVPPKAGYGSQDIGAGPGAVLHFDVTLNEILR